MNENPKNNNVFTIKDETGEKECEVIFTFSSEQTKKNYIVYTDNTTNEYGELSTYAKSYQENDNNRILYPLENEEEYNTVEAILSKLSELSKSSGEKNE